jgi:hypothetical protein
VALVVRILEKDFEILVVGIIMTIIRMGKMVEAMMTKSSGIKTRGQTMMILAMRRMGVGQGGREKSLVIENRVEIVAPKDEAEVKIAAWEEAWAEVVVQSGELTPTTYLIRRSRFHVIVSSLF